jgi:hypothetical protein
MESLGTNQAKNREKQRNHCHSQDNPLRAVDYGLEYFSLRQASKELF